MMEFTEKCRFITPIKIQSPIFFNLASHLSIIMYNLIYFCKFSMLLIATLERFYFLWSPNIPNNRLWYLKNKKTNTHTQHRKSPSHNLSKTTHQWNGLDVLSSSWFFVVIAHSYMKHAHIIQTQRLTI